MDSWLGNALLAMLFAGITSILAKYGLEKVDADLGLLIRTAIIFILVIGAAFWTKAYAQAGALTTKEIVLLLASGTTAFLSWIFYFRALKDGPVSYVVPIDKASIVVTLLLSFVLLREPLKPQVLIGGGLILIGLLVMVWK